MAPGNNERQPGHTGTIPKTKARNNCNVPQEAVTPTRRDMATNLVSTSLDWVPVSEYNSRGNYNQSRKQTNNTSDHELTDLDNSVSYESGFGRFVPVRPQPRVLPLNVQNQNIASDAHDDGAGSTASGHTLHPYAHQIQNGLNPHSNHAAAAVMIVNPTTPNAVTGNMSQPFNAPNQNRNNLTRNLNSARNNFDINSHSSNNNNSTPPISNSRTATKTVNIMNNMYDQGQGFNNLNDNNHVQRESARALGEAMVAACPDAAAVERRLGQIREYIRVTSSLVDTMRNSEDEAYIEHTKEEYDELVEMVMKLKESETKLESMLVEEKGPDNIEVPAEEPEQQDVVVRPVSVQSNGSAYSENELWQNEIKNKMEISQMRLTALKQQQKRLLKYQEEAKQQLEEMNRERQQQSQDSHPSGSHDNFGNMNQSYSANYQHTNRMFNANPIGVATTLPHASDNMHGQQNLATNIDNDQPHSSHTQDERFSHRDANISMNEGSVGGGGGGGGGGGRDSDVEDEDEAVLSERARLLHMKLRELQLKKQHMESLVSEFQKLQMASNQAGSSRNTYSSSGEDSGVEDSNRKFIANKSGGNLKNEDPFKLMEIKAIKAALQKTKDLMRSVETYESDHIAHVPDESFQVPNHSNIHENKSEGTSSMGGWSNEGSVCRVRNSLPQRHKFTNEQHEQQQQHQQQLQQQSHEANIATLQELAQELRMETEKIMGERARIKDMVSNKEGTRKQKKVNEEVRGGGGPSGSGGGGGGGGRAGPGPGPAERRQLQLRALLADKQRELEALLNKEKVLSSEPQPQKPDSRASVVNQSYASEQEEPDSRSEQILLDSQNLRENENFRACGDSGVGGARSVNTVSAHLGSIYGSDSDSASRNKSNQRSRVRRRQPHDRLSDEINAAQQNNTSQNIRHDSRGEPSNVNMVPPIAQNENPANMPYPPMPQPCWNNSKSNQDMRNQFTQNSHSQTMERLLGTPQMTFPPSMPYNMMMPYGMVGGCGCGCGLWGAWCWQQVALQQREIHQLREQVNHLEERWRSENVSHTLNNQVPPGNRANNYWDNFRSYSRQNLLSANSKTNLDGHLSVGPAPPVHCPHPLVARSHNALRRAEPAPPSAPPSAPVPAPASAAEPALAPKRNTAPPPSTAPDANIKRKSSSKLPAKNSGAGRSSSLQYPPSPTTTSTTNINMDPASGAEAPNPNLAPTCRELRHKDTSKLFDLLRENVYSEVTALIGVNESHPDFLIQLFRELQLISSDPLRQRVLQSIRGVALAERRGVAEPPPDDAAAPPAAARQVDNKIVRFLVLRSEDTCTPELLEALLALVLSTAGDGGGAQLEQRLRDQLAKYEGMRVGDVSAHIIDSLPRALDTSGGGGGGAGDEADVSESPVLQDVAGSLNLFGSSSPQLHALGCPFELWAAAGAGAEGMDGAEAADEGSLAEADQARPPQPEPAPAPPPPPPPPPPLSDAGEPTPTEAEAEWLGLDRVPTRLHMEEPSEKQKD